MANPTADSADTEAMANPTADSADNDTKDTDEGASDQRALQEAAPSHANALSSVEQHPGEEEI